MEPISRRNALKTIVALTTTAALLLACEGENTPPTLLSEFELDELERISPPASNPTAIFIRDPRFNAGVTTIYQNSERSSDGTPRLLPTTTVALGEQTAILVATEQLRVIGQNPFKIILPDMKTLEFSGITGGIGPSENTIQAISLGPLEPTFYGMVDPIPVDHSPWEIKSLNHPVRYPSRTSGPQLYMTGEFAGITENRRRLFTVRPNKTISSSAVGVPVFDPLSSRLLGVITSESPRDSLLYVTPLFSEIWDGSTKPAPQKRA